MHIRRLTVALVAAVTAATAGAAANTAGPPLLTYAVAMWVGGWVSSGLCATDLQGKSFRLSDPQYNAAPSWSPDGRAIAFLGPADPPAQDPPTATQAGWALRRPTAATLSFCFRA